MRKQQHQNRAHQTNENGYSLVELVVVIGIIMVLSTVWFSNEVSRIKRLNKEQTQAVEEAAAETLKKSYANLTDGDPETSPFKPQEEHAATDTRGITVEITVEGKQCIYVVAYDKRNNESERELCADQAFENELPEKGWTD